MLAPRRRRPSGSPSARISTISGTSRFTSATVPGSAPVTRMTLVTSGRATFFRPSAFLTFLRNSRVAPEVIAASGTLLRMQDERRPRRDLPLRGGGAASSNVALAQTAPRIS
jgi:hypothetical protein